ncbi:O-methyltransferase [Streptomyces albipurpureus]|uniref:Class I SAM-dependent methyltransferase n=1 Tax=Streptomyces albipurpureus TaxID=2897419 RepID=A0ABT0UMU9_9ACTN|nr:class I SAM-dependent methyltransferase [Streptomyces sp. CWNU-1]MCM2389947.1 class I SAM-dependent methyltransferase [Streptomyces sp. CWNU-1]
MAGQVELTERLLDYVRSVSLRDDEILRDLIAETALMPALNAMVTMPEEAQMLALLVGLTGADQVLEIGTFTGYSTLCMARALPPGGRIVTCDVSERWTKVASRYWTRAGVADRIELRLGDGAETMSKLLTERGPETFDLVFIDADKTGYAHYYEQALVHLRVGGLVVLDNTLYVGRVADPEADDPDTMAIRALNASLHGDKRVDLSMLVMADGITLARKNKVN